MGTLNVLQQNRLIDKQTEGLLRLVINGGLGSALVVKCFRSSLTRSLHYAIVVTVIAGTGDSLFNYTEDVPQLNHVPLLRHASEWRATIESVFAAGWMCGVFAIVYAAIINVQRGQAELCRRVDPLSQSENKLRQSNARLALALQQLRETQQQLVQRERLSALGQMASGVAHDLNNALSPVVTYAQLLSESTHQLTAEQTLWIECIERCSLDAVATIGGLQQFYQQEPNVATRCVVSLDELIRQVVDALDPNGRVNQNETVSRLT